MLLGGKRKNFWCYLKKQQRGDDHHTVPTLLQGEEKERFNAIAEELSQLATKFSNNVLDGECLHPFVSRITNRAGSHSSAHASS